MQLSRSVAAEISPVHQQEGYDGYLIRQDKCEKGGWVKCLWLAKIPMTVSLFFFPLFSSQGLAAHGSCNSLRCCPCPLCHVKVEARLVSEGLKPSYSSWVTKVPLPSIVSLKSNEPSLGEAWGSCLSAHRSVPKSRQTGGRELDGLVWIQSWPGSEEGPAMQRESNRTSRCVHVCVLNGCARVWRCWCVQKVRDESCLPPPQPLTINQDWSGGTDYLCKNNMTGVSTSPPLSLNSSMSSPHIQQLPSCSYISLRKSTVFIPAHRYSVGWWNGIPLSWWRGEGPLIDQQCCKSPTSSVIRNRLLVFIHFWQVITLMWRLWSLNICSMSKTWGEVQFELYWI